jgi:Fe-S cluster biosynthesis and repair protein YggX
VALFKLVTWKEIQDNFADCLLLGNGASIAIDRKFAYHSLLDEARASKYVTHEIDQLFQHFQTQDFEHILRMVWNTYHVNQALGINEKRTLQVYSQTREALIKVVQRIHVSYDETQPYLPKISQYLKHFNTIISLNYDLIVYWAFLLANKSDQSVRFKDCFLSGEFDYEWKRLRESIAPVNRSILVFYPHGNLVLATGLLGGTIKIARQDVNEYLIDRILAQWKSGKVNPLFVSEGESSQKVEAILRNSYLSTVYNSVLCENKDSIAIYGWSVSDNDDHILKALLASGVRRIAVSVYAANENWQYYCHHVDQKIQNLVKGQRQIEVVFYDSASEGCWNS